MRRHVRRRVAAPVRRTLKEMADIQFLLQLPGVDQAEIRRYFDEAGLSERFDEIKALASDRDPGDGR
jgi:hypothetical protein